MWYESLFQIKVSIILHLVYIKQEDLRKILIEGFDIVCQRPKVSVKNTKKSILTALLKLLKFWRKYKVRLSKVDYEEENCWQWDMAWDIERAANNLFDFLNYKIKYFPDETFYEWYVYIDCKCRCLLVEQKEEGISKGFYHVYENDTVSMMNEKNNRRIMIYSKNGTILTMFNG